MCIKRCSCSGIVKNYRGNIYADICPKGKLKNSFVTFPNLFRSVTVEKPKCFSIGNVDYLTTGGTGFLTYRGKEIEGAYSLIMADSGSHNDRFTFEFFAQNISGYAVALYVSLAANVTVCKSKRCNKKKKPSENTDHATKRPVEMAYFGNYARLVIFHPNGRVEEEDLISCWNYR